MKNTNIRSDKPKTAPHHNERRPDIRDDMDSRSNEEYDIKGTNVTHNEKQDKKDHRHREK